MSISFLSNLYFIIEPNLVPKKINFEYIYIDVISLLSKIDGSINDFVNEYLISNNLFEFGINMNISPDKKLYIT